MFPVVGVVVGGFSGQLQIGALSVPDGGVVILIFDIQCVHKCSSGVIFRQLMKFWINLRKIKHDDSRDSVLKLYFVQLCFGKKITKLWLLVVYGKPFTNSFQQDGFGISGFLFEPVVGHLTGLVFSPVQNVRLFKKK